MDCLGIPLYSPSEVCVHRPRYTFGADIWALGMTICSLTTRKYLLDSEDPKVVASSIKKLDHCKVARMVSEVEIEPVLRTSRRSEHILLSPFIILL